MKVKAAALSLLETNPKAKEVEQKERQKILEKFTNGPFEDIVARSEAKVCTAHHVNFETFCFNMNRFEAKVGIAHRMLCTLLFDSFQIASMIQEHGSYFKYCRICHMMFLEFGVLYCS